MFVVSTTCKNISCKKSCNWNSFPGASCSLAADGGDAGTDHTEEGAAAGDAHADPSDEVVDSHEVSRGDLVKAGLVLELGLLPQLSLGLVEASRCDVARGELAVLLEPPDHTKDPPEEATAAKGASTKAHNTLSEGGAEKSQETGRRDSHHGQELGPKAPYEPGKELAVHVSHINGSVREVLSGWLERLAADGLNTVPGRQVRVAVGVLSHVADKCEVSSAHGQGADASTHLSAGASVFHLLQTIVRHRILSCSFSNN